MPEAISEDIQKLSRTVGHDFNNLLTGILGSISLAQEELHRLAPARVRLDQALLSAQRATILARQLLALSGVQRAPQNSRGLDLNSALLRSRQLFESTLPREAVLSYQLEPDLPPANLDEEDARAISLSLISNAGESLPEGSGFIRLKTGISAESARVWIEIEDNGSGIAKEIQTRLGETPLTTRPEKRGLGLFFVHSITTAFGGAVEYLPSEEGTRVRVSIPHA